MAGMLEGVALDPSKRKYGPLDSLKDSATRVTTKSGLSIFAYDVRPDAKGAPLVLIHGLGDEGDTWRRVLPLLSHAVRVVAIDLPGFGRSDKPTDSKAKYTVPWYAQAVVEVLDEMQLGKVVLVGHSMGGMIADLIALKHPERMQALGLIGGGLLAPKRSWGETVQHWVLCTPLLGEMLYSGLRKDPRGAYNSLRGFYFDLDALPEEERMFLWDRVQQRVWDDGQRHAFFKIVRSILSFLRNFESSALRKISVPSFVCYGAGEGKDDHARRLVELHGKSSTLAIVNGAGHNVQQEHPAIVARLIEGLFSTV